VRTDSRVVADASHLAAGTRVEVELAEGGFDARVEDTRP
jgi:hypothetical protein